MKFINNILDIVDNRPLDELLVPSKDIRKYHEDINFKFSDSDRSTLIVNSKASLNRKVQELTKIYSITNDTILKEDIELYINFIFNSIYDFINNDNNEYIYILYIWEQSNIESNDGWYTPNGYFVNFNDIKNVINILIKSKYNKNSLIRIDKVNLYNKNINIDEEDGYIDNEIGSMYFDYGFIPYDINNNNFKEPDRFFEKDCFYYKWISVPYPFKFSDIITSVEKKYNPSYRKIITTFNNDSYEEYNNRITNDLISKGYGDYSDTKMCISLEDGDHDHINIINIEYYKED